MTWKDGFMAYALDIAKQYQQDADRVLKSLEYDSITSCLCVAYSMLVKEGDIKPIEVLGLAEKRRLWEQAKTVSDDIEKSKKICKCLHLLNCIVN